MSTAIEMPADLYDEMRRHLLHEPDGGGGVEQAAFLFTEPYEGSGTLRVAAMRLLSPEDFDTQTDFHISVADHVRPQLIQSAWQQDACLIEAHSHIHGGPVGFSPSDLAGFDEWVPHLWWRLRGRPYTALVFGFDSFDALCWQEDARTPEAVAGLALDDGRALRPTNRTLEQLRRASRAA